MTTLIIALGLLAKQGPAYDKESNVPYCTVNGKTLTLNSFVPVNPKKPAPVMVEIHGGWFVGGSAMEDIPRLLVDRGAALFSINYRLGDEGGFPQAIRDCRNAIRFIRKNAKRYNIDPNRIAVMGGSAGGHLSLMTAMVPEGFEDGGPTPELKGISAKVCGSFSWIPPTDFIKFWDQAPEDVVVGPDGKKTYRYWNDAIPNDARPHLRRLFHMVAPDSPAHRRLYTQMSPVGHVRKNLPPLLICDGEHDPIVPGLEGKDLYLRLQAVHAESTYWMSHNGHEFPTGAGFDEVLNKFLDRIYK